MRSAILLSRTRVSKALEPAPLGLPVALVLRAAKEAPRRLVVLLLAVSIGLAVITAFCGLLLSDPEHSLLLLTGAMSAPV